MRHSDRVDNQDPRSQRGFSLMQVLVVVGIVAALASVIYPATIRMVDDAKQSGCIANLRKIGVAVLLYAADHQGDLPPGNSDGVEWFKLNGDSWLRKYGGNDSELGAKKIMVCPGDRTQPPTTDYKYYYSYTWNAEMLQAYVGGVPAHGRASVKSQAALQKILFADGLTQAEAPGSVKYPPAITSQNAAQRLSERHQKGLNVLFGDGRVQWLSKEDAAKPELLKRLQ